MNTCAARASLTLPFIEMFGLELNAGILSSFTIGTSESTPTSNVFSTESPDFSAATIFIVFDWPSSIWLKENLPVLTSLPLSAFLGEFMSFTNNETDASGFVVPTMSIALRETYLGMETSSISLPGASPWSLRRVLKLYNEFELLSIAVSLALFSDSTLKK